MYECKLNIWMQCKIYGYNWNIYINWNCVWILCVVTIFVYIYKLQKYLNHCNPFVLESMGIDPDPLVKFNIFHYICKSF